MASYQKSENKKPLSVYADELRHWLYITKYIQYTNQCYQTWLCNQILNPSNITRDNNSNNIIRPPPVNPMQGRHRRERIPHTGPHRNFPLSAGTEVRIPTVWKRAAAEVIDAAILLMIKLCISYLFVSVGGFKAVHILDFDLAMLTGEIDFDALYYLSTELMLVELFHRILVAVYEALCLAYVSNIIPVGGFTPGKRIMGLAVVACDEVFSLGNDRYLITGMRNPHLSSAGCTPIMTSRQMESGQGITL